MKPTKENKTIKQIMALVLLVILVVVGTLLFSRKSNDYVHLQGAQGVVEKAEEVAVLSDVEKQEILRRAFGVDDVVSESNTPVVQDIKAQKTDTVFLQQLTDEYNQIANVSSEGLDMSRWKSYSDPVFGVALKHPQSISQNQSIDEDGGNKNSHYRVVFEETGLDYYPVSFSMEVQVFYNNEGELDCSRAYDTLIKSGHVIDLDKSLYNPQATFVVGATDAGETYTRNIIACFDLSKKGYLNVFLNPYETTKDGLSNNYQIIKGIIGSVVVE